jgi:hypothetical protein
MKRGVSDDPHCGYKTAARWWSRPGDSAPLWRPDFLDEAAIGVRRKGVVGGRSSGGDQRGREFSFYRGRGQEASSPRKAHRSAAVGLDDHCCACYGC